MKCITKKSSAIHFPLSPGQILICSFMAFLLLGFTGIDSLKETFGKYNRWVGTWGTARQLVEPGNMPPAPGLSNNTLRQVVCVSVGGKTVRLKFSNEFSKSPVTLKMVKIAVSKGGSTIEESTTKALMFEGKPEITMEPGTEVFSDPIAFKLNHRMEIAITISFGATSPTLTGHPGSRTTSYLLAGNHNEPNIDFSAAAKADHWYVIDGIDVELTKAASAAVGVIGDSITDGRGSGTNLQNRWPDILEMALQANKKTRNIGVINMGIGGNAVLQGGLGPTALNRYGHDILNQQGLKWVIIFEGVNDLGATRDSTAANNVAQGLINAFGNMISQAHSCGLKVYGATITPFNKSNYYRSFRDDARNKVNDWIRAKGHYDGVIDFDKALRDPANISTLLTVAQTGDYLHPNELGYKMMGQYVDLSLFN
jgi:lysophospholipase L1-like esterase